MSFLKYIPLLSAGVAARETAQALRTLAQAARGVAACTKEPQAAAAMLDSAQCVMEGSAMLIHEAHQALVHPGDADSQQRLAQVTQEQGRWKCVVMGVGSCSTTAKITLIFGKVCKNMLHSK